MRLRHFKYDVAIPESINTPVRQFGTITEWTQNQFCIHCNHSTTIRTWDITDITDITEDITEDTIIITITDITDITFAPQSSGAYCARWWWLGRLWEGCCGAYRGLFSSSAAVHPHTIITATDTGLKSSFMGLSKKIVQLRSCSL